MTLMPNKSYTEIHVGTANLVTKINSHSRREKRQAYVTPKVHGLVKLTIFSHCNQCDIPERSSVYVG